jgi:predicted transcriptional regulator
MARPSSRHPTELELQILKILWRDGPAPVREVRDALVPYKDLAYTSVMTIMNIMTRKGYLRRSKQDGRYIYSAKTAERTITRRMLSDLVDRVFDGSAAAVMVNLLEAHDLDSDELKQLRELINRKAREEKQ